MQEMNDYGGLETAWHLRIPAPSGLDAALLTAAHHLTTAGQAFFADGHAQVLHPQVRHAFWRHIHPYVGELRTAYTCSTDALTDQAYDALGSLLGVVYLLSAPAQEALCTWEVLYAEDPRQFLQEAYEALERTCHA